MTTLFATLILTSQQTPLKASEVISKCLAKYASANSGVGEFLMTQSSGNKKVTIKTELQFERPSKLFLHQTSETIAPNDWLVVSDGVNFGYDKPSSQPGPPKRLFEPIAVDQVISGQKTVQKIQGIYLAAKRSIGDVGNPFLEFATQSTGDNMSLKGFLARLKYSADAKERTNADGTISYSVNGTIYLGDAIKNPDGTIFKDPDGKEHFESAGRLEMLFSKDFDLQSMKSVETISVTDKANNLPTQIVVVTSWTGKLDLNQAPSAALFKVR